MLDICCGAGGDLDKWNKAQIAHYVGLDLSSDQIKDGHERHKSICQRAGFNRDGSKNGFSAIFIVSDAAKEDKESVDAILEDQ